MSAFIGAIGVVLSFAQSDVAPPTSIEQSAGEPPALKLAVKYGGVVPGGAVKNPLPRPKRKPARMVWTGFRPGEAGAEVFVQTTEAVKFDVVPSSTPRQFTVFLRDCLIHMRNNARNLDTSFFATPVAGVSARQRKRDVELTVALKTDVKLEPRNEPGPDGTQFLVLQAPPVAAPPGGDVAPPPRETAEAPALPARAVLAGPTRPAGAAR